MKKFKLKTRMQWGWFKAAMIGACLGLLIAPAGGFSKWKNIFPGNGENANEKEASVSKENPISAFLGSISFGGRVKVLINGETVALAGSSEDGEAAFKAARLAYNADGIRILDVDVSFEEVDKERDADTVKGMKVLKGDALSDAILASFDAYVDGNKELAYTMRVDDYTVTVDSMENLVAVLEQTQGQYDTDDCFQVNLSVPESRNVTMYEVGVAEKPVADASLKEAGGDSQSTSESGLESDLAVQAADDGVKYIGFSEDIQVMQTYVDKGRIKDRETAYRELTEQRDEPGIYVVEPGDYLEYIAGKTSMTVEQIKELNPGIESDENLYYDDRLNITIPTAAVQVLVQKQETYEENYYEDVVYEDDADMYIGETEVIQEGSEGTHIVTDLVTYKNDLESGREQIAENIEVAAVAQIVRRGTKSKPTYMYPVTNWNVTSNFGYRWGRLHAGTDVGVPVGTTVRASRAGQVITAGWVGGYGNCVMIDHGDGVWTVYGHLSEFTTSVGSYVDQGEQIALSGNTGRSTGPHLHFEIRVNGTPTDATPYLEGTAG